MQQIVNSIDCLMGQRLSQRRSELSLTVAELANKLDITSDQLEAHEQGKKRMDAVVLHKTSKILEVEMIYFFEEDENSLASNNNEQLQKLKVSLSPEEEAQLLGKLADIEDPAMRQKAFKLFKLAKERLS